MKQKYSLFLLERRIGGWASDLTEDYFCYQGTYDTLEEAQAIQKEFDLKTIILTSW